MTGGEHVNAPGLQNLQESRDRLLRAPDDEQHDDQFLRSIEVFLESLCSFSRGRTLLKARGDYVLDRTAPGTPYAVAWERTREHVRPSFNPVLQRPAPQLASQDDLDAVRGAIHARLEQDEKDKADYLLSGKKKKKGGDIEPFGGQSRKELIAEFLRDRALTDETRRALEAWQAAANDLIAELEGWPSAGCRRLLQIHRQGRECLEAARCSVFAAEIKEAAFLLEKLSRELLAGACEGVLEKAAEPAPKEAPKEFPAEPKPEPASKPAEAKPAEPASKEPSDPPAAKQYWHAPDEPIPSKFHSDKSITGTLDHQRQCVGCAYKGKPVARETLHKWGRAEKIWIVKHNARSYEAYFREHDKYAEANRKHLELERGGVNPKWVNRK